MLKVTKPKVLLYGFWNIQAKSICEVMRSSQDIEFKGAIGVDSEFLSPNDIVSGQNFPNPAIGDNYNGLKIDEYYEIFLKFSLMMERRGERWKPINELKIIFFNMLYYGWDILDRKSPHVVIFNNVPHEGFDYVLYSICKRLKIKTVILYQSIFPNKFFVCDSIENVGRFIDCSSVSVDYEEVSFEKISMPNMDAILGNTNLSKAVNAIRYLLNDRETLLIKLLRRISNKRYKIGVSSWLDVEEFNRLQCDPKKTIYFPLHFQPEMTSVSLAGIYEEQYFAIYCLRSLLPKDWIIFIKENPKQDYFQRSDEFLNGLHNLDNTYLLKSQIKTEDVLERSAAVATLTGSAGWEAIVAGKKSIIFGNAWYRTFSNVLEYPFNQEDLISFLRDDAVSRHIINSEIEELISKSCTGIIDPDYNSVFPDFDFSVNAVAVSYQLSSILKNSCL